MELTVGGVALGTGGSELALKTPGEVAVTAKVAAFLDETPNPGLGKRHYSQKPYWHIERARIGESRQVKLEVIVNGYPAASRNIEADGTIQDVSFDVDIERSSWVSVRILGSSHTNPVFVVVGGKPIRASRRSADWCLKSVDRCWSQKKRFIARAEMKDAELAYEHARKAYRRLLSECEAD